MGHARWDELRDTLDRLHAWPGLYTFKFIVPSARLDQVRRAVPDLPFAERRSSGGRYVSLTATIRAGEAGEVVEVYRALDGIPGLVSL